MHCIENMLFGGGVGGGGVVCDPKRYRVAKEN